MTAYAGIGSRQTPDEYIKKFEKIGRAFAKKGLILRSGGADGADSAFERGCDSIDGPKEIFLPWKNFNGNKSSLFDPPKEAFDMASKFHPGWHYLKQGARRLHARNCQQILGVNLDDPVAFVVCYTRLDSGGTLQALRVAGKNKIPVFNFYVEEYSIGDMLRNYRVY